MFDMRDLSPEDDVAAGKLLGRRFVDDAAWRWIGPRWKPYRRLVSTLFHIGEVKMARRRGGWIIGGYEDGKLVAVTIGFPDGEKPRPWMYWVTRTVPFIISGPAPGIRALLVENKLDAAHPKEPHVHAWLVGAEPEAMGAGALLIRELAVRADALEKRSYLEATAPHLVALYKLLGYETTETLHLKDGSPIGLMWREVGASRSSNGAQAATANGQQTNEEVAWDKRSAG